VNGTAIMRKMTRKISESAGHEVVAEAIDGDDVVSKYTALQPDTRRFGVSATS
jgi:chemotaxis response regulator CheB